MSDSSTSGHPRGRALAQERRRQQAVRKQGGRAAAPVATRAAVPAPAARTVTAASPAPVPAVHTENLAARSQGREAALAYRAMRCAGAQCWSDPEQRRPRGRRRPSAVPDAGASAEPGISLAPPLVPGVEESFLDSVCGISETQPEIFGWRESSVRQLCRARRQTLSQKGKVALTVMRGLSSAAARLRYLQNGNGREFARLRRGEVAQNGRGQQPAARATGQQRSRKYRIPEKVESGTTLSGTGITGTQVDRKVAVTGNEQGSCRSITGTEYVGSEQFDRFCGTRPSAGPAKVAVTSTSGRQAVTGTMVGRAVSVTGDESGACRPVTGTEYLGNESFQSFCRSDLPARPEKVAVGATLGKNLPVTGSDEARVARVTGYEPGAQRTITGSQYSDAGVARMTINGAPRKVDESHTLAGRPVSGTTVDTSGRITGTEAGECRNVTGTEYLSQETFRSVCSASPAPVPTRSGVTSTESGQRITGNLVDRSEKVTGNEPGSCQRVTGTGYSTPGLCGGGVDKVQTMTSLAGGTVTGTGIDHLPKMTGDGRGGCWPVTGTEYYGQEQYAHCESTPQAESAKVGLTRTDSGLPVTGPLMDPSALVTGNEAGLGMPVTGTPYAAAEIPEAPHPLAPVAQSPAVSACSGSCCDSCAYKAMAGAQETVSPVAGVAPNASSYRFVAAQPSPAPAVPEAVPAGFSIAAPVLQGRSRITGNTWEQNTRITGPVNLARGLVTGTPEFRARDILPAAPSAVAAPAATGVDGGESQNSPVRGGWQITGDDWSRNSRVTGTEGRGAQTRNPTQRGQVRSCVMSAALNRGLPLAAEVGESPITGSSGNSRRGSLITYSGGARG